MIQDIEILMRVWIQMAVNNLFFFLPHQSSKASRTITEHFQYVVYHANLIISNPLKSFISHVSITVLAIHVVCCNTKNNQLTEQEQHRFCGVCRSVDILKNLCNSSRPCHNMLP